MFQRSLAAKIGRYTFQIRSVQTPVNQSSASSSSSLPCLQYKPLARSGNFILDYRKDRQIIEDGYSPKGAEFKLRFELLDQNDIEFMTQYVTENFINESNITRHLGLSGEELIDIIGPQIIQWIGCKISVLIKDEEKIVGAAMGSFHAREEFDELYRGQLFHDNPKFDIKDDYAEVIKNGPFKSHNLNRLGILLDEIAWQTGKFLPKDTQKLALHELTAIHPKYMRYGLATKSMDLLQKMMLKHGCTHEAGYCVATGTSKMTKKFGHQTIYSLPYNRYLENGKPVFENLSDGATAANITLLAYKDHTGRKY